MRHHYREPASPPPDFRLVCGRVRAFCAAIALILGAGCAAREAPEASPSRDGELPAAWQSYAAFCALCPKATGCCLKEEDFSPARYSASSGRYLRALREHYECRRGDLLIDATLYSDPLLRYPEERVNGQLQAQTKLSCEQSACGASAELMAAELDGALARPVAHAPGAPVACSVATP
jgi:hypothetical protein